MRIEFLAPAEMELIDASSYYNIQSEGLGFEFAAEVKKTIERIIQHPEAWTKLSNEPVVAAQIDFLTELFIRLKKKQY